MTTIAMTIKLMLQLITGGAVVVLMLILMLMLVLMQVLVLELELLVAELDVLVALAPAFLSTASFGVFPELSAASSPPKSAGSEVVTGCKVSSNPTSPLRLQDILLHKVEYRKLARVELT